MLYPNKHTRFEESILYKMLFILELNELKEIKIISLYDILKKKYQNIDEFIYSIDVLYSLNLINVDFEKETVIYA
ncbi:MAG TPA: ABC-three component system middle component 7 [Bacteroidia bacterium]|jgi:hypothetical protein|nr:ABC-three component system middle component 7 [Bacteroidia bacterium]